MALNRISAADVQELVSTAAKAAATAASAAFAERHVGEPQAPGGIEARVSIGLSGHTRVRRDNEPDHADLTVRGTIRINPEQASAYSVYSVFDYLNAQLDELTSANADRGLRIDLQRYEFEPPDHDLEPGAEVLEVRWTGTVECTGGSSFDDHLD